MAATPINGGTRRGLAFNSLQTRLTVIILAIFLISLGALGGINHWQAERMLAKSIDSGLATLATMTGESMGDWLDGVKLELSGMANAPVFQSGDPAAIVPFLQTLAMNNKKYESFAYVNPAGFFNNNTGASGDLSHRAYIRQALAGVPAISDPVVSKATGRMVVVVAVPVKTAGKVTGALFGAVDIDSLTKRLLEVKAGKTGYAFVVRGDGLMIIHPNKDLAMKINVLEDKSAGEAMNAASHRMVKGEKGSLVYEYKGMKKMISYAPVPGTNWAVCVTVPHAELSEDLVTLRNVSMVTVAVVLVLAALAIALMARRIAAPLKKLVAFANEVAAGDVSERHRTIYTRDETGQLADAMFRMRDNLRALVRQINASADQVAASAEELTASAEQSAQAANQIAASITGVAGAANEQLTAADEASAVVTQMSAGIQQVAANGNQVAGQTTQAAEKAKNGGQQVDKAVRQMGQIESSAQTVAAAVAKLGEQSKEIGQIVGTIAGIAGQTNLLALNAAIEAARAGEQGRGFAVVAEEVRKLAEQSQAAAGQIADLIENIQRDTDKAVAAMDTGAREVKAGTEAVTVAGAAFGEIVALVTRVSDQVQEASGGMQQMAVGSERIVGLVRTIDALSKTSAGEAQSVSAAAEEQLASMEEVASSSQALAKLAEELQAAVSKFRV
ncbi:methyl-accepting chemotaxis protein [Anaeroselena agilis]|uniref:Methyl-accepting chemotaxis protein n=1 Tax=Anaeroselena agilis TaxID=3063788 RepID=A0ABU3P4W0_9FIRM|nr:methyl-accepting chemotaxis protein [Selenomonadales bacterium 4137-cl]